MNKYIIFILSVMSTTFLSAASESKAGNDSKAASESKGGDKKPNLLAWLATEDTTFEPQEEPAVVMAIHNADLAGLSRLILDEGMTPNEVDSEGETLLQLATRLHRGTQKALQTVQLSTSLIDPRPLIEKRDAYLAIINFLALFYTESETSASTGDTGAGVARAGVAGTSGAHTSSAGTGFNKFS